MSEYKAGSFTLADLEKIVEDLEKAPKQHFSIQIAADDYSFMSDEEFRSMCQTPAIHFLGGAEGVRKMRARMDKLGIKY